jgi:hypothetical protein
MKTLSIIGIAWAVFCFILIMAFNNAIDYEASGGWGMFACIYLLAFSIVCLAQSKNKE